MGQRLAHAGDVHGGGGDRDGTVDHGDAGFSSCIAASAGMPSRSAAAREARAGEAVAAGAEGRAGHEQIGALGLEQLEQRASASSSCSPK